MNTYLHFHRSCGLSCKKKKKIGKFVCIEVCKYVYIFNNIFAIYLKSNYDKKEYGVCVSGAFQIVVYITCHNVFVVDIVKFRPEVTSTHYFIRQSNLKNVLTMNMFILARLKMELSQERHVKKY